MSVGEGLITLSANISAKRMSDKSMRAEEFYFLGKHVSNVPISRVHAHKDPTYLSKLCDVILKDFQRQTSLNLPLRQKL